MLSGATGGLGLAHGHAVDADASGWSGGRQGRGAAALLDDKLAADGLGCALDDECQLQADLG